MTTILKPTKAHARKIIKLLDHGLTNGLGSPEPGKMCVEAAVCYAMGLPHSDEPPCVGEAVRAFKIKLNDCAWSSNEARADGMKKLAIAQLGSNEIDQMEFGKRLYTRGVQTILPTIWKTTKQDADKKYHAEIDEIIQRMESVKTFKEAQQAAKDASAYASASASAYASASASAYAYAYAYASASASASAYASAYASASAYAYAYASDKLREKDRLLRLTADTGLEVLIEMKSPGCKWLTLFDK